MPGAPSSPTSRRRRSSQHTSPLTPQHSRQSSLQQGSPSQPNSPIWRRTSRSRRSTEDASILSPNAGDFPSPSNAQGMSGMDSLADELANAWDADEGEPGDEDDDTSISQVQSNGLSGIPEGEINNTSATYTSPSKSQQRKPPPGRRKHSRTISAYEGSEYGELSDGETLPLDDFPQSFLSIMSDIEDLTKSPSSSTNSTTTTPDTYTALVTRITHTLTHLTDRRAQQSLEAATSTLISTDKGLSSYLRSETRNLQNNAHFLFLPRTASAPALPDDAIDELLPLLATTADTLPSASVEPALALADLVVASADSRAALKALADALHMSLQVEATVARRLRGSRELVAQMRAEYSDGEEGRRFLEEGDWSERLKRRDCARECREVVGGFEEVCQGWRDRLVRSADVAGGGVGEVVA